MRIKITLTFFLVVGLLLSFCGIASASPSTTPTIPTGKQFIVVDNSALTLTKYIYFDKLPTGVNLVINQAYNSSGVAYSIFRSDNAPITGLSTISAYYTDTKWTYLGTEYTYSNGADISGGSRPVGVVNIVGQSTELTLVRSDGTAFFPPTPTNEPLIKFTNPPSDVTTTNSTYSFTTYAYIPVSSSAVPSDVTVTPSGVPNINITLNQVNISQDGTSGNYYAEAYCYFTSNLNSGDNNVTLTVSYSGQNYSAVCKVSKVVGVVDANGDGIDDRTNLPINDSQFNINIPSSSASLGTPPSRSDYSNDVFGTLNYFVDTFVYYVTWPFKMFGAFVTSLTNWFATSSQWVSSVTSFFSAIFGFLPAPIVAGITGLFTVMVFFSIIKIIRG